MPVDATAVEQRRQLASFPLAARNKMVVSSALLPDAASNNRARTMHPPAVINERIVNIEYASHDWRGRGTSRQRPIFFRISCFLYPGNHSVIPLF